MLKLRILIPFGNIVQPLIPLLTEFFGLRTNMEKNTMLFLSKLILYIVLILDKLL